MHIVLAEDEEHLGYMVKFKLTKAGYSMSWKRDGLAAWEAIEKEKPDLAILDVMMPGMNGFQVLEKVKATPSTAKTTVIMLTAKGQESDVVQGIQAGAAEYIVKPFKPAELLARIQRFKPADSPKEPA